MADAEDRAIDELDRHTVHVHNFHTHTYAADNHQHVVMGATGPARGQPGPTHIHRLRVRTSFHTEDTTGHWHWFDVMTGPPVYTAGSEHVHVFKGPTSFDEGHTHDVMSSTSQVADIENEEGLVPPIPPVNKPKTRSAKR
jgi:hypothetical protein